MKFFITLFILLQISTAWAVRCEMSLLSLEQKQAELRTFIQTYPNHEVVKTLNKYNALKAPLKSVLNEHQVHNILLDQEFGWTARQLDDVMDKLSKTTKSGTEQEKLEHVLRRHLKDKVPAETVDARIAGYFAGGDMHRALGELTKEEVGLVLHGGSPLAPTANSRLGKLIREKNLQTVVRSFEKGPGYVGKGPDKLVIAFDDDSADAIKEFLDDVHIFGHNHGPDQGTLSLFHQKKLFGWFGTDEISTVNNDTMLIPVLLSSSEGQRMENFASLYRVDQTIAERPWEKATGYCAAGGYDSCTHWVGNIPIGDVKVPEYKLPGKVDDSAYHSINPNPELDKLPRSQPLANYQLPDDMDPALKLKVKTVWKVPGNEQLAYTLNLGKAQEGGMLANPGWVAHTFLSRLKEDRSPFIFVKRANAREVLPVDFNPRISPY